MKRRQSAISKLQIQFFKDYKAAMQHYSVEERIEFTQYLLKVCNIYYNEEEEKDANKQWMLDEAERLKKKYGKNYKYYRDARMYKYFHFDIVLSEAGIYDTEEFNQLEEQTLNKDERQSFMSGCCRGLQHELDRLYLQSEPESNTNILNGIGKTEKENNKTKIKRNANDKLTSLTQEQTALLLHYLQQERVFLKDEYLNNKDAGIAFEMLTGYSQNTLRQNLGSVKAYQNKTNLKEIDHILTRLQIAIDKALKEK